MSWLEITFWVIQIIFDLFALSVLAFLFMALGGMGKQQEALKATLFAMAAGVDENFQKLASGMSSVTTFLVKTFNHTEVVEPPKKITPPDWKN